MDALILAAGKGSRLNHRGTPKPLVKLLGMALIERIILTARNAGVDCFKIVVGYRAERFQEALGTGEPYGVTIEYIPCQDWEKGNGVSVLAAKEHMADRFLLLMADHLFDESILRKLLRVEVQDDECVLCIDRNLKGSHFSLDDATKVWVEGGLVHQIAKTIPRYNALDTGFFLCTPALFDALELSVAEGDYGLSGGNQVLANMRRLRTLDITGHFWIDVDDEVAYQEARRTLLRSLIKPTDGPISKWINRRISTRISAQLANFDISPSLISVVGFLVAVLAAGFFAVGGHLWVALGGLLAQLASILDGCDGEVARLRFKHSPFGGWLDKVLDRYADGLIVLGMTHALWLATGDPLMLLVGGIALMGTFVSSYTAIEYDRVLRKGLAGDRWRIRLGRDLRLFLVFLGGVANQLLPTLLLLIVITHAESVRRLVVLKQVFGRPRHRARTQGEHLPAKPPRRSATR